WAELRFYFLITILVVAGVTYGRVLAFCGVWLVAALGAELLGDPVLNEILMPRYAPYFVAGMSLYLVHRRGSAWLPWIYVVASYGMSLHAALERVHGRIERAGFRNMPDRKSTRLNSSHVKISYAVFCLKKKKKTKKIQIQ